MRPLVIYHDNCADGFGAAFAAWLKLGDEAEYLPMQYGQDPTASVPEVAGREVYILDFSFERVVMDGIFAAAKRVVWLDHHKTAFEMWNGKYVQGDEVQCNTCHENSTTLPYIILSSSKSGAILAWEYFHPGTKVPTLIEHIDDYDRWQFSLEGTKAFNKALWSYAPWSFEQWRKIEADAGGIPPNAEYHMILAEGAAILRAHDQNVRSVVKGGARGCVILLPTPNGGWRASDTSIVIALAANCPPHLTSDVGHELATQSGTFGLCWCLGKKDGLIAQCSLRSNGDYDVSAIAKAFGGGGHKNAAGFEVPIETLLGWLK